MKSCKRKSSDSRRDAINMKGIERGMEARCGHVSKRVEASIYVSCNNLVAGSPGKKQSTKRVRDADPRVIKK